MGAVIQLNYLVLDLADGLGNWVVEVSKIFPEATSIIHIY